MKKVLLFTILITLINTCPNDQYCSECRIIDGKHTCLTCNYSKITQHNVCESVNNKINHCIVYNQSPSLQKNKQENKTPQNQNQKIDSLPEKNSLIKKISQKKIQLKKKKIISLKADTTSCKVCERNYGISENGKDCIKCEDPNCSICPNGVCSACNNNTIPISNSCQITKTSTYCIDPKCEICDFQQECVKCQNHFALNDDGRCVKSVERCLQGDDKGCFKCEFGFYVDRDLRCDVFSEVLPHSFFEQFVMFLVVCAFLGILAFFGWKKYNEERKEALEKESEDEGVTETLM